MEPYRRDKKVRGELQGRRPGATGLPGVQYIIKNGNQTYVACVKIDGQRVRRSFGVNIYGDALAKELAIKAVEAMMSGEVPGSPNHALSEPFDEGCAACGEQLHTYSPVVRVKLEPGEYHRKTRFRYKNRKENLCKPICQGCAEELFRLLGGSSGDS